MQLVPQDALFSNEVLNEATEIMNIELLIRPNIKSLQPYRAARHDYASGILLDANENSFGSVISFDDVELNRYPDPLQAQLRSKLASLYGVQTENVFVGVGSDEAIDLLMRVFCEPGQDSIVILEPTYGMYRVSANINNVAVRSVLLTDDFQIDIEAVEQAIDPTTKMIFCCSPNNPTANLLHREDILTLARQHSAMVVVDEAYVDFSSERSLVEEIQRVPNLVVLRTLSKAWGLAALRLGAAIAQPTLISYLLKIKAPYNINALTHHEALRALPNISTMRATIAEILVERQRLAQALANIEYVERVFPSEANFLLVRVERARSVYEQLAQHGIIVRDRSAEPKLAGCLRITVGTPEQNDALITAMREIQP